MRHSPAPWLLAALALGAAHCTAAEPPHLTLPPVIHAVPGQPVSVYFDNIVLTRNPGSWQFKVTCPLGTVEKQRWTLTAADRDTGEHAFAIEVRDANGTHAETARALLRVAPRDAGADRELRLLIVGDSLTNASHYPNEIARLLSLPGNPRATLLGTHQPSSARPGVAHEGYGGWRWESFLTKWDAAPATPAAGPVRRARSPFLFADENGVPELDLPRYFREHCAGSPPDVVSFLLGINDCFGANPDDPAAVDAKITEVLGHAEKLLAAFRAAAPEAVLAVGLTTPPNARESGFEASYKGRYHRWGWKRIQHRLVRRMITQFQDREAGGIHLVPTGLNLDPWDGYPDNNGVHPNPQGYAQIGGSFYAWLKNWLAGG